MTDFQFPFMVRFPALAIAILKPLIRSAGRSWQILSLMICGMAVASADQFGNFTYTDDGSSITITGYPTTEVGVVIIPDTIVSKPVTAIGANAFQYCNGLTSVTIPSNVSSIGNYAFYNCSGLQSVSLPTGLTVIATGAFWNCTGLPSMTIPYGTVSIGANAFKTCTGMTSLSIPSSVTNIGIGAFAGCGGLVNLVIPSTITSIAAGTFSSCSGLTSLTIPASVTIIGDQAFQYCRGLTSIHIPASVMTIGTFNYKVFDSCSSLIAITVDAANPSYSSVDGFLTNKTQTTLLVCPAGKSGGLTIPSCVTSIGALAFLNCAKVTGVNFPPSVTSLGGQAFSNCIGLTTLTFPSSITSIENQAFSGCSSLLTAYFKGNAPTIIYTNSFQATASGFTIYYLEGTTGFTSPTWFGYPAFILDVNNPLASWLISKGLPANSDLHSDSNGDGVNLLMAYALNLEPAQNLSNAIPQGTITAAQMSLSFYAGASGVTYAVQCSSDMVHWSSAGVSYSNNGQIRTATVAPSGANCFMRLAVSY